MKVALVAAVAENRVIGRDNSLPWRLPGDLPHFRRLTMGKTVVMGRRTFESIGHPLGGRDNIVLSRDRRFSPPGVYPAGSVADALAQAVRLGKAGGSDELLVIGGGAVYEAFLSRAQSLYLTLVHACPEGDCYFPVLAGSAPQAKAWRLLSCCRIAHGDEAPSVSYMVLEKTAASALWLPQVESCRFQGCSTLPMGKHGTITP